MESKAGDIYSYTRLDTYKKSNVNSNYLYRRCVL